MPIRMPPATYYARDGRRRASEQVAVRDSSVSPVAAGESQADFDALRQRMIEAVQPRDALEQIWAEEAAVLEWELIRLRRLKASVLETAATRGLESIMRRRHEIYLTERLVERWHAREQAAVERVRTLLGSWGLSESDIIAHGAYLMLAEIERIDQLLAQGEDRRNRALREITLRRQQTGTQSLHAPPMTPRLHALDSDA